MTIDQAASVTRPQSRAELEQLVASEASRRMLGAAPQSREAAARVEYDVALAVAWAEIERLRHERDHAIDVVLEELEEEAAGEPVAARPFPLRPDLHAARLLARADAVSMLRELYAVLLEAFVWDGQLHPHEELVAAYVNDIANAAAQQSAPSVLWPVAAEYPADDDLAEVRTLRDDVARLLGIGPGGDGTIHRLDVVAALTRCVALGTVAGERTWELGELRREVARILGEIDDMPCLHSECPGPVEPSPKPRCSLCHTRMALRTLLAKDPNQSWTVDTV
ncbi:hypothetical protein ACWEOE_31800 [Amycolatopsis sp. NPDC004368]